MTLRELIQGRFGISGEEFKKRDVAAMIHDAGAEYSSGYVSYMLQDMLRSREIVRTSRGLYKFPSSMRNIFAAMPDDTLKSLYSELKVKFPFVDFCMWDVHELLPLMHHIPSVRMKIVSCAKDVLDSVSNALINLTDTIVLPSPDQYAMEKVALGREVIVVLPLVSQAPVETVEGVPAPRLEKVLVDILCEEPFYYLRGSETWSIYETALNDYEIKLRTLRRYASRRNRLNEVDKILKEIQS